MDDSNCSVFTIEFSTQIKYEMCYVLLKIFAYIFKFCEMGNLSKLEKFISFVVVIQIEQTWAHFVALNILYILASCVTKIEHFMTELSSKYTSGQKSKARKILQNNF